MAKKKKAKPEVQTVSTEDLETAIDEVNIQFELEDPIEKGTDKYMGRELKEVMEDEELFEGGEEFTSGTYDVLEALGIEHDCVKVKYVDDSEDKDENGEEEVIIPKEKQERTAKRTAKKETKKGETMKTKVKTEKKRVKRLVSKKNIVKKKDTKKVESKEKKDVFGFRVGSKKGEIASLMATGKYSKNDIQKKCKITYSLNKTIKALRENGRTVTVDSKGKVKLK